MRFLVLDLSLPLREWPNFSLNADAIWRPLRGRAVAGQLCR